MNINLLYPMSPVTMGNAASLIIEQLDVDQGALQLQVNANRARSDADQDLVYHHVYESAIEGQGKVYFVQSAGSYGKKFSLNTVANAIHAQGGICLFVASSGIAALLLDKSQTAHSMFSIPIVVNEASITRMKKGSSEAELMCKAMLLIWDLSTYLLKQLRSRKGLHNF